MAFGSKNRQRESDSKDNRGVLYESDRKRTAKSPDFWGFISIDGRDYKLSGWEGEDSKKRPCLKLAIKPKQDERRDDYERDRDDRRETRQPREDNRDYAEASGREPWSRGNDEPPEYR